MEGQLCRGPLWGTRISQKLVLLPWFLLAMAAAPPYTQHIGSCFSKCRYICPFVGLGSPSSGGHRSRVMYLPRVRIWQTQASSLSAWSPTHHLCQLEGAEEAQVQGLLSSNFQAFCRCCIG